MLINNYKILLFLTFFTIAIKSAEEKNNDEEVLLFGKFQLSQAQESEAFFKLSPTLWIMNMSVHLLEKYPITQHREILNANGGRTYQVIPAGVVNFLSGNNDLSNLSSVAIEQSQEVQTDPYESYKKNWQQVSNEFPFNIFNHALCIKIKHITGVEINEHPYLSKLNNLGILLIHFYQPIIGNDKSAKIEFAVAISKIPNFFADLTDEQKEFIVHLDDITKFGSVKLNKKSYNFKNINSLTFLRNNFSREQIYYIGHAFKLKVSENCCSIQ